jgi:hypothetical protein
LFRGGLALGEQAGQEHDEHADPDAAQRPEHPVALGGIVGGLREVFNGQHAGGDGRAVQREDPKQSPDYGRVINRKNFDRLAGLIGSGTVAAGGQTDPDELYIAPTVLVDVPVDSPIMQEEA